MNADSGSNGLRRGDLVVLAGLALLTRIVSWSTTSVMMNDGPDFLWQAEQLLAGHAGLALSHPYHPLYGAAVAAASWISGSSIESAGIAASM